MASGQSLESKETFGSLPAWLGPTTVIFGHGTLLFSPRMRNIVLICVLGLVLLHTVNAARITSPSDLAFFQVRAPPSSLALVTFNAFHSRFRFFPIFKRSHF